MATVLSRAQRGLDAPLVRVEVDVGSAGLPAFTLVGLPEAVVKESKDRVRAAICNCRYEFPQAGRLTVNLSPADLPKEGVRFDLPIAMGILIASGQVPAAPFSGCELYGELSLDGHLRGVKGALLAAIAARRAGNALVVPEPNSVEVSWVGGARYAVADHLQQVALHATQADALQFQLGRAPESLFVPDAPDLADVRGQHHARRALEIAAAGEHSLLMIGPPGTGKSMLAQRLPGLLPALDEDEALEVAAVRSLAGIDLKPHRWRARPYRAPHHTASAIALVGGGAHPKPGEISLAHRGVLFLDELPEFDRRVLEVLREPLETGFVTISRAARQAEFPAAFQFVAAMNPCPCGHLGDPVAACACTKDQVQRYRSRISGPLLDRLDMQIEVTRVPPEAMRICGSETMESSAAVAERVARARQLQTERQGSTNARLAGRQIEQYCRPTAAALALLERAASQLGFSARAYSRVLKLARTIADLEARAVIGEGEVSAAMALRKLDRGRGLAAPGRF